MDQQDDWYECVVDVVDDVVQPSPIDVRCVTLDVELPGQRPVDGVDEHSDEHPDEGHPVVLGHYGVQCEQRPERA